MPLQILKSIFQPIASSLAELYFKDYAGLNYIFYRHNNVVASNIETVRVRLREQWNPPHEVGEHIKNRLIARPPDYDGRSLKLWSFAFDYGTGLLDLEVSYGKYSQYLFTNLDNKFKREFPNPKWWFNALNIGALVLTSDDKIRLHRRPQSAVQSPGKLDTPCGHPSGMEKVASDNIISAAIAAILKKELGFEPTIASVSPIIAFIAHPCLDFNLMYLVSVKETSKELDRQNVCFVNAAVDSLSSFLRARRRELSRSLPDTLLCFINNKRLKNGDLGR